jgi:trehalose 6-phosphate phosphatase
MGDAMASLLADPGTALIALDFDGTLAPIVARPQDARPALGVLDVLRTLARSIGTLAVVSGRAAEDVVQLGELGDVPGLRVLGHYGLQSWRDGVTTSPDPDPGVDLARRRLPQVLASAPDGVRIEDKLHSMAVHTRRAASPQEALDDLTPALWELADEAGLEAVPGKYVLELRPAGVDKGTALRALIDSVGASTVIYVGDDLGDLPAFRVVTDLRAAGIIEGLVAAAITRGADGQDEAPPEVRAQADLVLPGPEGVVGWLTGIVAMLG